MYYELGTMVRIRKDASPFVYHEKGIGHPWFDVIGEIVGIRPTILSYTVRLSKKYVLTFYQDDIYELPDCISSRHDVFHKMISTDKVNQPFYYSTEFESFIDADAKATKEAYTMFNKTPKYSVNDIVIIGRDSLDVCGHNVVGIINDVCNHKDTGDVFYHIIFNSGTPRKLFEHEIKAKFDTGKFKDGQSIHKQLLAKMYHTRDHKYFSEKDAIAWMYANFEVKKEEEYCEHDINTLEATFKNLQQNSLYGMHPEYFPGYHFTPARRPLKALEELNKREFERIAAEPIRFEIDDMIKANYSKEEIKKMINKAFGTPVISLPLTYKKIIFSGPCTIILWKDGTKTIAKTSSDEEVFDPEKGVAICFMKKMLGHTETNKILRKASEQYKEYIAKNRPNSSFDEFIDFCKDYFKSETKSVEQSTIDEVKKVEEEQDD